jgi:hypothetical protein
MSYSQPTGKRPCMACGRLIDAKWPICFHCKSKLSEPLQRSLMGAWKDRSNDSRFGLYYRNVLTECLAYLKATEPKR